MKSRHDFATLDDYREYLRAYYAGQILARTANGLAPRHIKETADAMVDALYPEAE